jgi:hypothetical protein
MVHQNAEYFERCQAADYDPSASMETRHACWSRWLAHYTEGQPTARVRHAHDRLAAIEAGEPPEPLPGVHGLAVDTAHAAAFLTEDGSALPASPPDDPSDEGAPRDDGAEDAADAPPEDRAPLRRPPRHRKGPCADICLPEWEQCARGCEGRGDGCLKACEAQHRVCASAC